MRGRLLALIGAAAILASPLKAQSVAELRAQYQQTQEMLNQAEAAGLDPAMLSSLRESLEGLKQTIDEMERDEAASQASASAPEPAAGPAPAAAGAEENLAAPTCRNFGFDENNYRAKAVEPGPDLQIRTLCGQAYEYYAMYKRALAQQHPEAWKTYDAHRQSAAVVNNFWSEARARPGEGIVPDTKTAAQIADEEREAAARAAAAAPQRPPPAPECDGCVTPQ